MSKTPTERNFPIKSGLTQREFDGPKVSSDYIKLATNIIPACVDRKRYFSVTSPYGRADFIPIQHQRIMEGEGDFRLLLSPK